MRYTMAEALHEMRHLRDADTGRLRGVDVADHLHDLTGLDTVPAPWGARLAGLVEARTAGTVTADTPQYLVFSDGLPVAWATVTAAVVTPDLPMTAIQARHQRQAVAVLADLDRATLRALADERDHRDARPTTDTADERTMPGALRVAPAADPTATRWVRVGADLDTARAAVARAVRGGAADDAVIVTAVGYGHHGDHAHRLSLAVLCAMHAIVAAHPVSLAIVGHWIDDAHGLAGHVDPQLLAGQFTDAYIGRFASRRHYVEHRMQQLGWTDLLRTHGLEPYFDHRRFEQHLFTHAVTGIDLDRWQPWHGIEVFHRRPTTT
ncbi:hypothetical protein [Dactylosporangium sp. CA-092794]|uniref:hypothetical protein n=1 Tax=Dactylosporangium sp. CA-092794 TaxID=3239929 RepID=UPI003D8A6BBC